MQSDFLALLQIKLSGTCCLLSAVLCVVVTVTTTVIHMNRLQTLRECVYQAATKTCTCFAGIIDPITQDSESAMHEVCTRGSFFMHTRYCVLLLG